MLGSVYDIGNLDERIEIWKDSIVEGPGEHIPNFKKIAEVWSDVREASGQERESSDKETAFGEVIFYIRYDADFKDERMRVKWDDDFYDVTYISMIARKRFLEIRGRRLR